MSKDSTVQKKFLPVHVMPPSASAETSDTNVKYEIKFPNGITIHLSGALQGENHTAIIGAVAGFRP
jgi:hypothetical protein